SPPPPPGLKLPRLYAIKTPIPEAHRPKIFDWTHKNAMALQKIGHDAALPIARRLAGVHSEAELEQQLADFRFDTALKIDVRAQQVLDGIFWPAFRRFGEFTNGIQDLPRSRRRSDDRPPESAGGRQQSTGPSRR